MAPLSSPFARPENPDQPSPESVRALAVYDAAHALAVALAESNAPLRDELLQAALRGWAENDPEAAADWARAQSHLDSGLAFAAVFNGAIRHPERAVLLEQRLSAQDPENAGAYAGYLIFALGRTQKFALAAQIAAAVPPAARTDLLTAAYVAWGENQPSQALSSAVALDDPAMRRVAFQAVIGGWARANPRQLTEVAMELTAGPERTLALTTALRHWIAEDPAGVAEWAKRARFFPEIEATLEE